MRFASFADILRHFAACGDGAALRCASGDTTETLTYGALLSRVLSRAQALRDTGKTSLGVLCDGSADCVTEIFAAVEAGMQVVLLNENADEAMLAHTDVDLLWGDAELVSELSPALTDGVKDGKGKLLFFTSGTTAKNRAVVLTQESLCASAWNGGALLPLSESDTLLCMLPLDHVFGFVCGLLWGLSCGACVALGRGARHYFDDCSFFAPTALSAVPQLIGFLLKQNVLNPELSLVLIGAGDCPPVIPQALRARGIRVHFGYGLTETSSGVALSLGEDVYAMTVCPDDEITLAPDGEILIRVPSCVMQGYYKDPAATAEALKDGVLYTGDLGKFDENGLLHVIGRKKEILVLSDGTKIFLPEYEQAIAAVLGQADFAVIESGGAPALVLSGTEEDLAAALSKIAPVMQALPFGRRIKTGFALPAPLPRTATGKLKRWEITEKVKAV